MKKEYLQPQVKAHIVRNSAILAGSPTVGNGSTSEQNAKRFDGFYDDEDDDY